MSLNIGVVVDNAGALGKMVSDLEAMKVAMVDTAGSIDKMSAAEGAHYKNLDKMQSQVKVSTLDLIKFAEVLTAADKAMAGMAIAKTPFSKMESDLKKLAPVLKKVNAEIRETNTLNKQKLGNSEYMKMVTEAKAAIILQDKLNAEIEKQARLLAEIAMLKKGAGGTNVVSHSVAPLKEAQSQTGVLEKQLISEQKLAALRQLESQGTKTMSINTKSLTAAKKAELLVNKGLASSYDSSLKLKMEMAAAEARVSAGLVKAAKSIADSRAAQNKQNLKGADAINTRGKAEKDAARESKILKTAMLANADATIKARKATEAYNKQVAKGKVTPIDAPVGQLSMLEKQGQSVAKLRERFAALNKQKLPIEKVRSLNTELHNLGKSINSGNLQGKGLVNVSRQIHGLESGMKKSRLTAIEWGKSMKFAIGGVARSMGAMTYSYSMLAPLIAGMAVGSAIKKVYSLGTAFEYTTTYVDALRGSLDGINVGQLQSGLLDFEGLRKGPQELAVGLKEYAKAGIEIPKAMKDIEETAKFATIAELDMADATKLLISQSNAFGVSFSVAANIVSKAALSSATNVSEMVKGMSQLTELGTVAGVSLKEVATGMAVLAKKGILGTKAATAMRTSILRMAKPTEKLKKQLDGLNWSAFSDNGQINDVQTMFTELKKITDLMSDREKLQLQYDLFGLRAIKGGANLIASMGGEYQKMYKEIDKATEAGKSFVSELYDELGNTVQAKMEKLGVAFEKSLIKAFDSEGTKKILDNLTESISSPEFVDTLKDTVKGINDLGLGLSKLISLGSSIPGDIADKGLVAYLIFGKNPVALTLAGMTLLTKKLDDVFEHFTGRRTLDMGDNFKLITFNAELFGAVLRGNDKYLRKILEDMQKIEPLSKTNAKALALLPKEIKPPEHLKAQKVKVKFDLDLVAPKDMNDQIAEMIAMGVSGADLDPFITALEVEQEKANKTALAYKELNALRRASGGKDPEYSAKLQPEMDKVDYNSYVRGLSEYEQKLISVSDAAKKIGEKNGFSQLETGTLAAAMKADVLLAKISDLDKETKDLNFQGIVNGLRSVEDPANKIFNDLTAKMMEVSNKYAKMMEKGPKPGTAGYAEWEKSVNAHFAAAVNSVHLYTNALRSAKDQLYDLKSSLSDMKFGFTSDINDMRAKLVPEGQKKSFKYSQDISEIRKLKQMAEEAGKAGLPGRKRQVELLQQAMSIVKSIDTTENSGDQNKRKVNNQIGEAVAIQNTLLKLKNEEIAKSKDQVSKIEEQARKFAELVSGVDKGYGGMTAAAKDYNVVLQTNSDGTETWANQSVAQIDAVKKAYKELATAAASVKPPKITSNTTPARASGGPVTGGTEYLVGEKGPEMFTPNRSGYIIPNNQMQNGGSTVNVNFTFPGNNQVQLQGTKDNVDNLLRAMSDKQRYAA